MMSCSKRLWRHVLMASNSFIFIYTKHHCHRFEWKLKHEDRKLLSVQPDCGVIQPNESQVRFVYCFILGKFTVFCDVLLFHELRWHYLIDFGYISIPFLIFYDFLISLLFKLSSLEKNWRWDIIINIWICFENHSCKHGHLCQTVKRSLSWSQVWLFGVKDTAIHHLVARKNNSQLEL